MELREYLDEWLTLREAGLAARTIEQYQSIISKYLAQLTGPIETLEPKEIQRLIARISAEGHARTAQIALIVLTAALGEAQAVGLISSNPAARVLRPRHYKADPRYWRPEEIRKFIEYSAQARWGHAWQLAMLCGLRRGELAGLRWNDCDWAANVLHIRNQRQRVGSQIIDCDPKSAAGRRDIPIPCSLVHRLRAEYTRQRAQQAIGGQLPVYVVAYTDNRPIDPHRLNRELSRDIERAGLRQINLHGLRHSMATAAVAAGISIKVLQEILGHANYSTTADVYAHVLSEEKTSAITTLENVLKAGEGT